MSLKAYYDEGYAVLVYNIDPDTRVWRCANGDAITLPVDAVPHQLIDGIRVARESDVRAVRVKCCGHIHRVDAGGYCQGCPDAPKIAQQYPGLAVDDAIRAEREFFCPLCGNASQGQSAENG